MSDRFGLNQGTDGENRWAEMVIPGCKAQDNGSIIRIEFKNGKPIMYVWADINQADWTHRIELKDALESNREDQEMSGVGKEANGPG